MKCLINKIIIGAMCLVPIGVFADDSRVSALLYAFQPTSVNQAAPTSFYKSVNEKLEAYLVTQNIFIVTKNQMKSGVPKFDREKLKRMMMNSALTENDFGISYEITPVVSETSFSRLLKVSASGSIYNPASDEVITTFTAKATDTKILPKNKAECGSACVNNALSEMSYDLSREISFDVCKNCTLFRKIVQ